MDRARSSTNRIKHLFRVLSLASLIAWSGCASQGGTFSAIPRRAAEMRVTSNIPNTQFRYRIQKINAGSSEGWIDAGTGTSAILPLRTFTRYEISAIAPGFEEKYSRINEAIPQYTFKFLSADRLLGANGYAARQRPTEERPIPRARPSTSTGAARPQPGVLEPVELADVVFDAAPEISGLRATTAAIFSSYVKTLADPNDSDVNDRPVRQPSMAVGPNVPRLN